MSTLDYSEPRTTGTSPRSAQARRRIADASGFTLIELLVVMLIIAALAAIAIPSFLSQTGKAVDTQAKELARTGQTTAEAIATENDGSYEKVTPTEIKQVEPSVHIAASTTEAYLSKTTHRAGEYSLTAKATNGDEFTVSKSSTGEISRTCVSPITKTGCSGKKKGTW